MTKPKHILREVRIVRITYCQDCPHHAEYGTESECQELSRRIVIRSDRRFPRWCPLEKEKGGEGA